MTAFRICILVPLLLVFAPGSPAQDPPGRTPPDTYIARPNNLVENSSKEHIVIGSQGGKDHGHVVARVPGKLGRVYDGNFIAGLRYAEKFGGDSGGNAAGQISGSVDLKLRMHLYREYDRPGYDRHWAEARKASDAAAAAAVREHANLPAKDRDARVEAARLKARLEAWPGVSKALDAVPGGDPNAKLARAVDDYARNGNSDRLSFADPSKVKWVAVPGKPGEIQNRVQEFKPQELKANQNLNCNSLVAMVAPTTVPPGKTLISANEMDKFLVGRVQDRLKYETANLEAPRAGPVGPARPPVGPVQTIPRQEDKQSRPSKPGGVIISAVARIENLRLRDVASAFFDPVRGVLSIVQRNEERILFSLDPDDFAAALKTVFDLDVDPTLSITSSREKRGYQEVQYSGALFKTRLGVVMYETDELLGDMIFNREGWHRELLSHLIPGYAEIVHEADVTRSTGSRVFVHASGADFRVKDGWLEPAGLTTRVEVEGTGAAAVYYQRPLIRLARLLDAHFDRLIGEVDLFQEFARMARTVALAKWLKVHKVEFDRTWIATHKSEEHEFPALVPAGGVSPLFNGSNLNGWTTTVSPDAMAFKREPDGIRLEAPKGGPVALFREAWWPFFDLHYRIATEGPVEFVVVEGAGDRGAVVSFDTKGETRLIEVYLLGPSWSFIADDFSRQGRVTLPLDEKGRMVAPIRYGLRIPPGSRIKIEAAYLSMRY